MDHTTLTGGAMPTTATKRAVFTIGMVIALAWPASADAITIQFQAHDLADVAVGEDLWQYEYLVSGGTFEADQGFSVYFDPLLYASLSDPQTTNAGWDIIVVQPDPFLPSNGFYDALAIVPGASLTNPFNVTFVWLGARGTLPGIQPLSINQFDAQGNLEILSSGETVPVSTPEPSTFALMVTAAVGLLHRLKSRSAVTRRRGPR
jgi:hypothetical protein